MGNSSTKLAEKCLLLNKMEVPVVASSFKLASKNSDKIKEDELKKFWGTQMDPRLSQYVSNFLFGPLGNRNPVVEFQRFAELYVYCVRGTVDERIAVLLGSLGQVDSEQVEIAYPLIKEVRDDFLVHKRLSIFIIKVISSQTQNFVTYSTSKRS